MVNPNSKDPKEIVHAMVVTSQKIIDLMGKDLTDHFVKHKVSLINISPATSYGPDAISLVLSGKQDDIKKSLNQLKRVCYEKEIGIEKAPIKSLPPILKGYLSDMEDDFRFEKIFDYCSKDYLQFCKSHNVNPHPEVLEALK